MYEYQINVDILSRTGKYCIYLLVREHHIKKYEKTRIGLRNVKLAHISRKQYEYVRVIEVSYCTEARWTLR